VEQAACLLLPLPQAGCLCHEKQAMSTPNPPFWFKQRQCKVEPVRDNMVKATGPNIGDAYLYIQHENNNWKGALRMAPDGPDVATADADFPNENAAWNVAFELYRTHLIA
jgi:hypothetical protein